MIEKSFKDLVKDFMFSIECSSGYIRSDWAVRVRRGSRSVRDIPVSVFTRVNTEPSPWVKRLLHLPTVNSQHMAKRVKPFLDPLGPSGL